LYGYFPSAQYVVLTPSGVVTPPHFYVERKQLPADRVVYNEYHRCSVADPFYSPKLEDHMLLFRPLFWTSFYLDDYLAENKYFGATKDKNGLVLISSASSKTSFCLAFLLHANRKHRVVGLTSKNNINFCKSLGAYDDLLTYDSDFTEKISKSTPIVFVDVAGDPKLVKKVVEIFDDVKVSIQVGLSHWEQGGNLTAGNNTKKGGNSNTKTHVFFAPAWINKRREELGKNLLARMLAAWKQWEQHVESWVKIQRINGGTKAQQAYHQLLTGNSVPPDVGFVVSMFEQSAKL